MVNEDREGDLHYKLFPTQNYGDRNAWEKLTNAKEHHGSESNSRVNEAYSFFESEVSRAIVQETIAPETIYNVVISKLQLVFVNLKREERPHQIFESLNARGLDLSQPDLVRNYLAMRLPQAEQDDAYEQHWSKIESLLDDRRNRELSNFLFHYLARCTGKAVVQGEIYSTFRERMESEFSDERDFREELAKLHRHAVYYDFLLRPKNEPDQGIRERLSQLNDLNRTVIYPLLLSLYDVYWQGKLLLAGFYAALELLENYLVRHFLAYGSPGGLNRMFPALVDDSHAGDVDHLKRSLLARNYPTNNTLHQVLRYSNMYTRTAKRHLLLHLLSTVNRDLSQAGDVNIIPKEKPTIEHIMPQTLGAEWRKTLHPNPDRIHRELLNTLGNLTLVTQGWNSSMSNSSWSRKRGLLQKHLLPLNSCYFGQNRTGDVARWTEKSILSRTMWLVERFCEHWPDLSPKEERECLEHERHPHPNCSYTGTRITGIILNGKSSPVYGNSWNNAAQQFANLVAVPRSDFEEIASQMADHFSRHGGYRELSNGWWLSYMGSHDAATFLGELAALCELDDKEWSIEVKFYN